MSAVHTLVFDFDGVFTDNRVWVDQDGRESVACDRRDGLAFDLIRAFQRRGRLHAELFILSKEPNPVVLKRAQKMKLTCHNGIGDKLTFMRDYLATRFSANPDSLTGVVFLGNDLNDLPLMRHAGYSVAPADAQAARQILLNLLDNAAKYGPARQQIVVGLAIFDGAARLWVDDEGPGVPPHERQRVFEMFYRAARDVQSQAIGSGLGLGIVRELTSLHGGRTWIEAAPQGGARVVVEFPNAFLLPPVLAGDPAVA